MRLVTTRLYRNEAIARCYTGIPVSLSTETTQKHLNINTHHSPGKAAPPTPSRWLPPEHCPRRQYTCPLGWKSGGCHCSVAPGLPMKHIALLNRYYKKLTINKNTLYWLFCYRKIHYKYVLLSYVCLWQKLLHGKTIHLSRQRQ